MSEQKKVNGFLPTDQPDLFFEDNAVGRMKKEVWEASDVEAQHQQAIFQHVVHGWHPRTLFDNLRTASTQAGCHQGPHGCRVLGQVERVARHPQTVTGARADQDVGGHRVHRRSSFKVRSSVWATKLPTVGSCDALDPATFRTLTSCCRMKAARRRAGSVVPA